MDVEKNLTEQEGLDLIQRMIFVAKREQQDDGKRWIFWGYALLTVSVFTLLNLQFGWMADPYICWNIFGVLVLGYFLYRMIHYFIVKPTKVRTYTRDLLNRLNIGFLISLALILVAMNRRLEPVVGFPLLISLYGFWVLIHGTALDFKPSVIGAFFVWGFALVGLFLTTLEGVMLVHAGAVLCGYIIPGHIARNEFSKLNRQVQTHRV
jgi:hypothetical protein